MHSGCADTSDLFLIYKETAAGLLCLRYVEHCKQRGKCTHSVVLSIGKDHAPVKAAVSGLSCRNDLQLCREEIFLVHIIFFFQDVESICLYRFLCLSFFCFFLFFICCIR